MDGAGLPNVLMPTKDWGTTPRAGLGYGLPSVIIRVFTLAVRLTSMGTR